MGFERDRSTTDIIQKIGWKKKQNKCSMCYIDLRQTYDIIDRTLLCYLTTASSRIGLKLRKDYGRHACNPHGCPSETQ